MKREGEEDDDEWMYKWVYVMRSVCFCVCVCVYTIRCIRIIIAHTSHNKHNYKIRVRCMCRARYICMWLYARTACIHSVCIDYDDGRVIQRGEELVEEEMGQNTLTGLKTDNKLVIILNLLIFYLWDNKLFDF